MGQQLREGTVRFTADLAGSTMSTAYPTAATDGVALTDGGRGGRVVIMARGVCTVAPVSFDVHVYGYDADTGYWAYINSLNAGSSITSSTVKGPDASTVAIVEGLTYLKEPNVSLYVQNYERYATRLVVSNTVATTTTHTVSTWIGSTLE